METDSLRDCGIPEIQRVLGFFGSMDFVEIDRKRFGSPLVEVRAFLEIQEYQEFSS